VVDEKKKTHVNKGRTLCVPTLISEQDISK